MAQIENPYAEIVANHSTKEVIAFAVRCLAEARNLSALDAGTGEVTKESLMVAIVKSNIAFDALLALAKRLDVIDDTPTVVA